MITIRWYIVNSQPYDKNTEVTSYDFSFGQDAIYIFSWTDWKYKESTISLLFSQNNIPHTAGNVKKKINNNYIFYYLGLLTCHLKNGTVLFLIKYQDIYL